MSPGGALFALRVGIGATLFAHGTHKLFGWFGRGGFGDAITEFEEMGFRPAAVCAAVAGAAQTGGGALLALGLATPAAGATLVATSVPAVVVHRDGAFFDENDGYEYPAVLGLASACLMFLGPGRWSLDERLGHALNRRWMPGVALTVALAAVAVVLSGRRVQAPGHQLNAHVPASRPDLDAAKAEHNSR